MRTSAVIALTIALAFNAVAQDRRRAAPHPSESARLRHIITAAASAATSRTPAVSIAVFHRDGYAEGGFGLLTPERGQVATAQSIYWIASATKPFTATAIMRLVEQNKLSLDDPIRTFFPELSTSATVRQLLNQTAGLPEYTEFLDPYGAVAPQQVLDIVRTKPMKFQPGTAFAYTNTTYYLLGLIIEKVTGKSWSDFIVQDIATA